jgi:hypothetical protein
MTKLKSSTFEASSSASGRFPSTEEFYHIYDSLKACPYFNELSEEDQIAYCNLLTEAADFEYKYYAYKGHNKGGDHV